MVEKTKNALRAAYDNAQDYYKGIAQEWKKRFLTDAEYQAFMKTYSFLPLGEVPMKYHEKIKALQTMISQQAKVIRESEKGYATI